MKSILITNAQIVNEGTIQPGDIYIKNGRIDRIDTTITGLSADITIDAKGQFLLPGMIDAHVHFREPGLTHKGDIASESKAAVAGGITSYLEMPNTLPPTTTNERLEEKYRLAAQTSLANYAFYLGATHHNLDEIKRMDPRRTAGLKLFMGASTGNMLVDQSDILDSIFAHAPTLVAVHCEDSAIIKVNGAEYRARYGDDIPIQFHPAIRSRKACYRSTAKAVELAQRHGTRLHVLHLSTADELVLFTDAPLNDKSITVEACVHHLFFDERDYAQKGTLIKCNPAIKTMEDRDALIQAVNTNYVDTIGTDHAPHTWAEKEASYFKAPSGIPMAQHALVALLEWYHRGVFSLELIVTKTAHAPAQIFQIKERGFIREGYWADLVLVDPKCQWTVSAENIRSKCRWSPFNGYQFGSSISATIVSGQLAWHQEKLEASTQGCRLEFER